MISIGKHVRILENTSGTANAFVNYRGKVVEYDPSRPNPYRVMFDQGFDVDVPDACFREQEMLVIK